MHAPRQLLIVDSHGDAGELTRFLEGNGFACVQARGPLRVRAVLDGCAIDAIVWKAYPGMDELQKDFFRECERYPTVPVVGLHGQEDAPTLSARGNVVSLPFDAYPAELCATLRSLADAAAPTSKPPSKSELAFRNVFQRLRDQSRAGADNPDDSDQPLSAPATSINAGERAELFPGSSPARAAVSVPRRFSLRKLLKG